MACLALKKCVRLHVQIMLTVVTDLFAPKVSIGVEVSENLVSPKDYHNIVVNLQCLNY